MFFDNDKFITHTEKIYRHQIQRESVLYLIVYGDEISKRNNHPFENNGHKTMCFQEIILNSQKQYPHDYTFYGLKLWLRQ